ncbi:ATP-binding protein [Hydrogenophaga sp. BPS33]|uniref:ATP-binding protein n=1 Tax=Hydrogenophaga sp. BPS33 TaxID=2651974 RepID=UPI0013202E69|nr:ATP-binding protein [Hydrogenophaga sp. BPS33]QHE87138.1 ATP-binding protein [Hydrogenophaga sp. BPS33]
MKPKKPAPAPAPAPAPQNITGLPHNASAPFVEAVYRKELDPDLKGNPFVEALPALHTLEEYQRKLMRHLKVSPEERSLSAVQRLVRLGTLGEICIPLPRVVALAQSIHMMLFEGYRTRSPYTPEDQKNAQRLYEAQQAGELTSPGDHHHASQLSMALVGVPGAGKSFILKKIGNMFPPVIFHRELGRWQIPFLFVEMPYEGESRLALASHIFTELDRLMPNSNFSSHMETKRPNAERLLAQALNIAYQLGVGLIVVDEAQNSRSIGNELDMARKPLSSADVKRKETSLKKLLISASNVGHMPILFTGTMELESTLTERASLGRRKSGHGSATWQPLSPVAVTAGIPSEFDTFMSILFSMQWLPKPVAYATKDGPDWSKLFFKHTEGIPDLMVKLFRSTQVAAIRAKAESIDETHVEEALAEFRSARPIVEGLANLDEASLASLTDLFGIRAIQVAQAPAPRTVAKTVKITRGEKAAELLELIDRKVTAKRNRPAYREAPGASPSAAEIPSELLDSLAQADVRKAPPVATSPLSRPAA